MVRTPIAQLAHDIGNALFRVAAVTDHPFLKKELERAAVELVAYIDEEAVMRTERLVSLAAAVGLMNETNASVLAREIDNLKDMLSEEREWPVEEDVDITGIFSGKKEGIADKRQTNGKVNGTDTNPSKRQTEILQFVRQFPNGCRMAELSRNFSEVSKRTLRNDITALIEGRLLERVGERGPYSYIRALGEPTAAYNPEVELEEHPAADQAVIFLNEPKS